MLMEIIIVLLEDLRSDKQIKMNSTEEVDFKVVEFICRNATDFRIERVRVVHIIEEFCSNHKTMILDTISKEEDIRCDNNTIDTVFVNYKLIILDQPVDIDK